MSKYNKTIVLGQLGDRLKATVVARPAPGTFPIYIKTYLLTGGRVRHFLRILPDWLLIYIDKLAQAAQPEQERLELMAVTNLLHSIEVVARIGEECYGIPISDEAQAAIELLETFQLLSIMTTLKEQVSNDPENFRVCGHEGKKPQSFVQSLYPD